MRLVSIMAICGMFVCGVRLEGQEVLFTVSDPDGAAAAACVPLSVKVDLTRVLGADAKPARLRLTEVSGATPTQMPIQCDPDGTLWFLMPPGEKGERRFRLASVAEESPPALVIKADEAARAYEVAEGQRPVLRYNHGTVAVPQGIDPKYARGDYIHPLYGLGGEVLTDDYPKDHPHHRGVWWSWPVTRWGKEVRDIWAVRGVWARPVAIRRIEVGPVMACIEAESVWRWGDKDDIVREVVLIRAFRQTRVGRYVDIEIRLMALADEVAIGGRPKAGYGGFCLRAAPVQQQVIATHVDPPHRKPMRTWIDYSGLFAGQKAPSGLAILEHVTNPDYPNPIRSYPNLNCVMPAFPCDREVPLSKTEPLVLKHRLWIHNGKADDNVLEKIWAAYAVSPAVSVSNMAK